MSLHAQLSPEALKRLNAQRRNSTISSIVISILTIVLIALSLGLYLLPQITKDVPVAVIYETPEADEPADLPDRRHRGRVNRRHRADRFGCDARETQTRIVRRLADRCIPPAPGHV